MLREKPHPTDPYSLPQAYQRWLYKDYAYLWRQQTPATRQQYASTGSRFHLTGFQYWMKSQLTHLPDIVGWWKLDANLGATTPDSSKNARNATIHGASPAKGVINQCLSFDGLNDYLDCGTTISLGSADFTILAWVKSLDWFTTRQAILSMGSLALLDQVVLNLTSGGRIDLTHGNNIQREKDLAGLVTNNQWAQIGAKRTAGVITFIINKVIYSSVLIAAGASNQDNKTRVGCRYWGANSLFFKGCIDDPRIENRLLDQTEIDRHFERRYPA